MNRLISLATLVTLAGVVTIAQARDLGPDEAKRLQDAGTIKSFELLDEAILAQHPGARIEETELEDEYGRYIYQVDLRDAQGQQWDLELDASTGEILKNHQDD
ncbi:PepSY domain-containing protein [Pseudomonas sp. KHPS1]|uniref:PepSY domain-containing protein n=1 Tax=Ectopseudomonas hydrolytica TaxID=2493633 RepID=UPI000BC3140B|nr:PepSY domain-containing protein [Pseudomonas sp. KHPS1]ARS49272.1 peptidase [Pseudomonas mendocina]ATH81904.1 peptidase [Pseudomonas mendocina]UTH34641.1 PepSY domain-containing protein [Pseudomonas sp. KHPS1]